MKFYWTTLPLSDGEQNKNPKALVQFIYLVIDQYEHIDTFNK